MLREKLLEIGLSRREAEVAELVSKGLGNKDVASLLFIAEKSVKFHTTNIYKKLALKSRAQLIVFCMPLMSFEEQKPIAPKATARESHDPNLLPWPLPNTFPKDGSA